MTGSVTKEARFNMTIPLKYKGVKVTAVEDEVIKLIEFNPSITLQEIHEKTHIPFVAINGAIRDLKKKKLLSDINTYGV